MHQALRLSSTFALTAVLSLSLSAKTAEKQSQYMGDDAHAYFKADVLRLDPEAIILPESAVTFRLEDLNKIYSVPARKNPKQAIYLEKFTQWIEPITPPSMPANLNIPLDAMEVREPQGEVQVALPTAPAAFNNVTDGMIIPNGSVLKTSNGTVAILFGGVDSARLAPHSQAAVQMTVKPGARDAEVDIHAGIVFSKVGQRIGEKESYAVKTPFGTASAHGTDFVTVALADRVDVWVAQGTVELIAPDGRKIASAESDGKGQLKVMRNPVAKDAEAALTESSQSLTPLLAFLPMANQKIKTLYDRMKGGAKLTPTENNYLARIRKVPSLTRLTFIPPPTPPPAPVSVTPPPVVHPRHVPKVKAAASKPVVAVAEEKSPAKPTGPVTTPDPNSLSAPLAPKKPIDANPDVPSVRPQKLSLDLRTQDTSTTNSNDNPTKPTIPDNTVP